MEGAKKNRTARIWVLANKAGYDSDRLHEIVLAVTGQDSIRALNENQKQRVIEAILKAHPHLKTNRPRKQKRSGLNVTALKTPFQKDKIESLLETLHDYGYAIELEHLSQRMFGKAPGKLLGNESQAIIEALKSIKNRHENGKYRPKSQIN